MGNFRLEAEWIGGHGCQREKKSGETVEGCGEAYCPDCRIRKFVAEMNAACSPVSAILRHWPGHASEVKDNLNTKIREGNF